jgi:DNA-binding IscR family transcriptional regulator
MTIASCPQCGYMPEHDVYVMTEIERLVIETLRDVRKSPLSPVSAQVIADCLGYSQDYISRVLGGLRKHGMVCLPRGRCSGWVEGDVMRELSDILRGCTHLS